MELDEVANQIRAARLQKKLSAGRLAEAAGIDPSLLSRLENHRLAEMGYAKLARLLDQVGLEFAIVPKSPLPTLLDMRRRTDDD